MLHKVSTTTLLPILVFAISVVLCDASDEFIMFDVRTSYNDDYVKSAFSQVVVRHIFKVPDSRVVTRVKQYCVYK